MTRVSEVPYGDDQGLLRQVAGEVSAQLPDLLKRPADLAERMRLRDIRAAVANRAPGP
jgi:hypothetical protein